MPFINVMTNSEIKDKDALKAELGNDITAIPGKSEAWLMVKFEDKADMYFKGNNEPCAMFEISLYFTYVLFDGMPRYFSLVLQMRFVKSS